VNQRPELYGAAVADVGVMDMLRFQKFTGGYVWCPEYGCSDNKEDFENLRKYSPLHNIKMPSDENIQYPAVFVTTAENDDRVVPSHSYKYIAELQYRIGRHPRQKKTSVTSGGN
jgi:prolyl oligopeptidase